MNNPKIVSRSLDIQITSNVGPSLRLFEGNDPTIVIDVAGHISVRIPQNQTLDMLPDVSKAVQDTLIQSGIEFTASASKKTVAEPEPKWSDWLGQEMIEVFGLRFDSGTNMYQDERMADNFPELTITPHGVVLYDSRVPSTRTFGEVTREFVKFAATILRKEE